MKIDIRIIAYPLGWLTAAILYAGVFIVCAILSPFVLYQELKDPAAFKRRRKLWKDLKNEEKHRPK